LTKNKVVRSVLFLVILSFLASCGKHTDNSPSSIPFIDSSKSSLTATSVDQIRKTELSSDYSNIEKYKEDINSWNIKFSFKDNLPLASVSCSRQQFTRTKFEDTHTVLNMGTITVHLAPEDPIEVSFKCFISSNGNLVDEVNFKVNKSIVISGETDFQTTGLANAEKSGQINKVHTLLIERNGNLIFRDKNYVLKAEELISLGGGIASFPQGEAVFNNTHGLSGGRLELRVQKAFGDLSIWLRETNGGPQTFVPAPKANAPADSALNGHCSNWRQESTCPGKKGHRGEDGTPGKRGYNGGDSGTINLTVIEPTEIKISINYSAGLGSAGGKGGRAGEGGPVRNWSCTHESGHEILWHHPPPMMKSSCPRFCPCAPVKFPDGPRGDRGVERDGAAGNNGKNISYSIRVNGENLESNTSGNI
jgi:hypothetical protein